ncbi:MAG TPA: PQQ-dependent sugar dehydrogenase [Gemmataceae bacterium]|nr:PQQ-dependent sugar dehydrogenase [Gemmataceae bacterium]
MKRFFWVFATFTVITLIYIGLSRFGHQATGLKHPESVVVDAYGKIYIAMAGEVDVDGDGAIMLLENGKLVHFTNGLDDPKGLVAFRQGLFVADKQHILRIDSNGTAKVFVGREAFCQPPHCLNGLAVDVQSGTLYASDSGDKSNKGGAIFQITPDGIVTVVTNQDRWPQLQRPAGLVLDGADHLLLADSGNGRLYRIGIANGSVEQVAEGLGHVVGLAWDQHGRLFISDSNGGRVFVIARPGAAPILVSDGFQKPAHICVDPTGKSILVPDSLANLVATVVLRVPGAEVDETTLTIGTEVAYPKLQWTGWKSETEWGVPTPFRPVVLTHAGDGSNRVFVGTQHGVVHVFPNVPEAVKTHVFLDLQKHVVFNEAENEEGFLGLAFHPKYLINGEFFVCYTCKTVNARRANVVSRFRVSKEDPNRADPNSEEEILRIERPFRNHNGGTICFGSDGYLYVAVGDGGSQGDPHKNGQNLNTLLAKILRIDINSKDPGKNYAIPKDNPFVNSKEARPETWAYGLRNVWRMAFDHKSGALWAADVGQHLYEEVNLIVKGGNYGWSFREGLHPFGPAGCGPRSDLIDPIWEYHHNTGVCIVGGCVYRGSQFPELDGAYLYGDYVNGKLWALRYDYVAKRVVANHALTTTNIAILSFGEDERGEVFCLTPTRTGNGIYQFKRLAIHAKG